MIRYLQIAVAAIGLLIIFLLQRYSYAAAWNTLVPQLLKIDNTNLIFVFNKTLRLIFNDLLCMQLIWSLFQHRKYLKLAFFLFLVELVIVLPIYFLIKLSVEGATEISSPLLSQVHRMVVNPLLMFLLIAGIVYQRAIHSQK
ncbi:MAG: hypothetical protein KF856_13680 [Cyclobacteriaceae bacterium]|nr:hypothetical protein [Cyclobacteriaceae bacterium]